MYLIKGILSDLDYLKALSNISEPRKIMILRSSPLSEDFQVSLPFMNTRSGLHQYCILQIVFEWIQIGFGKFNLNHQKTATNLITEKSLVNDYNEH